MNRRILLITVVMCGLGFLGEVQASLFSQKIVQFYAGTSFGAQRLSGHRNERAFYQPIPNLLPAGVTETIYFADQKPFSNINGFYLGHIGFIWDIPETCLYLAPELYLGRGNTHNDLTAGVKDNPLFSQTRRNVITSIRQANFFGGVVQIGFKAKWDLRPYMLLGLESSQFQYVGTYIPRSQEALGAVFPQTGAPVDFPSTSLNKTKWLSGFLWGFGLEKQVQSFKIGADIRLVHYKEFKAATLAHTGETETFYTVIKPKNIRFGLRVSYLF